MGWRWRGAVCVLVALAGCRAEPLPASLLHVWRTDVPAYRDRHLEIRSDVLVFGTGPYLSQLHPIEGFDAEPAAEGSTLYTIHYRAEDGALLHFKVYLTPGSPAALRIENTDGIWRADGGAADPEKGA